MYKVYNTSNQVPLYLCWIKPILKCCLVSVYYLHDCLRKNFFWSLRLSLWFKFLKQPNFFLFLFQKKLKFWFRKHIKSNYDISWNVFKKQRELKIKKKKKKKKTEKWDFTNLKTEQEIPKSIEDIFPKNQQCNETKKELKEIKEEQIDRKIWLMKQTNMYLKRQYLLIIVFLIVKLL